MHICIDPDDRRPAQRARVRQEFSRAIERLQGDQIPDYVILRSLVAICREIHRRTEAERDDKGAAS